MKKFKVELSSSDLNYYCSSDRILSKEESEKKQRFENELCNLINISEIGVRNSTSSVTISKKDNFVEIIVKGENAVTEGE